MKIGPFRIFWDHIDWGKSPKHDDIYFYYFYWFDWAEKEHREFGFDHLTFDGQTHRFICLWFFNMCWSTQWTTYKPN